MEATRSRTLKYAGAVALALLGIFVLINGGSTVVGLVLLGVGLVALLVAVSGG